MKKIATTIFITTLILYSFVGCKSQEIVIDAKEIVDISVSGLNTKGNAFVEKDPASVELVVNAYRSVNNKDSQKVYDFLKAIDSINFKVDRSQNGLSNGDELTITAVYDADFVKKAKIKIENAEFSYTVSGLAEPVMVDPFAEIELVYEGISPEAKVKVYNRSEKQYIRDIKYDVEPDNKLRIGDKITVTAKLDAAAAEQQGLLVPDALTKEYIVENVDEYITDFNDIDEVTRKQMEDESSARIAKDLSNKYGFIIDKLDLYDYFTNKIENTKVETPEIVNIYFTYLKPGADGSYQNVVYYFYKITAYYAEEQEPRTVYLAIRFKDAIKKINGSIDINTDASKYSSFTDGPLYSIATDFDTVYNYSIETQKGSYEIQKITP